jgi:hypothetical protein
MDAACPAQLILIYLFSVSPANHHSTNFSIIIITRGWHSRPISGRSAEWTQMDSTPHYINSINPVP